MKLRNKSKKKKRVKLKNTRLFLKINKLKVITTDSFQLKPLNRFSYIFTSSHRDLSLFRIGQTTIHKQRTRRVEKNLTPTGFEPLTSQSLTTSTNHSATRPCLLCCKRFYSNKLYFGSESNRDHSKMKSESLKTSLEKSNKFTE